MAEPAEQAELNRLRADRENVLEQLSDLRSKVATYTATLRRAEGIFAYLSGRINELEALEGGADTE